MPEPKGPEIKPFGTEMHLKEEMMFIIRTPASQGSGLFPRLGLTNRSPTTQFEKKINYYN
jgi:hypothetical protein